MFSSVHMIQNRESTSRVHACESRVHPALFTFAYAYGCSFAHWNFLLRASKRINNAAKCFVSLKQNYSEGFICARQIFLALKRDRISISLYVEYSRTLI